VTISDCRIKCGDDGIALKNNIRRACRNITVTNCTITTRWAGFRIGPESLGGFENITYSNCVIHDTYGCGIKLQMSEETRMENILFSNIVMDNVTGPISMRLCDWGEGFSGAAQAYTIVPRPPDDLGRFDRLNEPHPIGVLRNIMIDNIRAVVPAMPEGPHYEGERHSSIGICGIPEHPIEGVTLSNIHVTFPGGGTAEEAARLDIPEMERELPEYFRLGVLPAYGLYAKHARALSMSNVRFDLALPDLRPAVVCDDVEDLYVDGLSAAGNIDMESLIRLRGVRNAFIRGSRPLGEVKSFVRIEGGSEEEVFLEGNDLRKVIQ
jgi:hypothetical protein